MSAELHPELTAHATRLLSDFDGSAWPVESVRGQISVGDASGLHLPAIPIAGSGYLLPDIEGHAVFGATSQAGDADANGRAPRPHDCRLQPRL